MKPRNTTLVTFLLLAQPLIAVNAAAITTVSLYSGTTDGNYPEPMLVGKTVRGDEYKIAIRQARALVNYPDPKNPVIVRRVVTDETGATVICPWYFMYDGRNPSAAYGTRVTTPHVSFVHHKVICDGGACQNSPELLFGKFILPKCKNTDGSDLGFDDTVMRNVCPHGPRSCWDGWINQSVCCQEFSVERTFTESVYFDKFLVVDDFREQEITDLDIDPGKIYLTFENDRNERTTCKITNFLKRGWIKIADLRDCTLPAGDHFVMHAESRFFLKETRPCGKFVARGVIRNVNNKDEFFPDWRFGWYECDGKNGQKPIEKQFTYSTRFELEFTESKSPETGL
ncbi:MAG: hypothetical protein A2583_13810 [Bdellovibrionales bacterium RIFOXYD1_FULL_53_11]|nr:MAG: hypothetical protein A2583_13810 [Bdellovibrionales bacterium RIFOXYD1_FULL_53_11]